MLSFISARSASLEPWRAGRTAAKRARLDLTQESSARSRCALDRVPTTLPKLRGKHRLVEQDCSAVQTGLRTAG